MTNTAQFANGTGTLTLVIPKKSAGNKLRVSVTVTANGVAATKGATFKVHK